MQELEAQNRRLLASQTEVSSSPADYLPRADHQRILSSRLEALTSEHKIELGNRLNQAERELRWRFETQATERESAAQAELRQVCLPGPCRGATPSLSLQDRRMPLHWRRVGLSCHMYGKTGFHTPYLNAASEAQARSGQHDRSYLYQRDSHGACMANGTPPPAIYNCAALLLAFLFLEQIMDMPALFLT